MAIIVGKATYAFNGILFLFCIGMAGVASGRRVIVVVENGSWIFLKLWPSVIVVEGVVSHSPIGRDDVVQALFVVICDLYRMIA